MWYPPKVITPPAAEPISMEEARRRIRIDFSDDDDDLELLIAAARDHAENYCGVELSSRTVDVQCDAFSDFCRLSVAPVTSITTITYVDLDGVSQTLQNTVYELRADDLDPSVVLKSDQEWPATQRGSRITVRAVAGYAECPPAIKHALLLFIADAYANRGNEEAPEWTAFDALLCNFRRGL